MADFGQVLFVLLVLLVTWVIQTPNPSQKPMSSLCVKFQPSSTPHSDRFWWGVLLLLVVLILVLVVTKSTSSPKTEVWTLDLGLEFDNNYPKDIL